MLDVLVLLAIVAVLLAAGAIAILVRPLFDALNVAMRRVGLAGASPESRTIGAHGEGRVVGQFELLPGENLAEGKVFVKGETWNAFCPAELAAQLSEGDRVCIAYDRGLIVTVLGRAGGSGGELQ